jgi:protocatechuate 3,4-dioxygenase beta subunit
MQSAMAQQGQDQGPNPVVAACPGVLTWIEFQLIDMEGNPVAAEPYIVKTPQGGIRSGSLDSSGRVRFDNIEPGMYTINFPNRDAEAWERI